MRDEGERCEMSDLLIDACAHCTGAIDRQGNVVER